MNWLGYFHRQPAAAKVNIRVSVLVEADDDGYHAFNPAFRGLHVAGSTEDEAVRNFADALPAYLSSLVRHGDPLPVGCSIEELPDDRPPVPVGAFLHHVQLQWHSQHTSGIS